MRISILALFLLALGGCAGTGKTRVPAGAEPIHKTPISRENPSMSQRHMFRRLQEGEKVTGRTDVAGALVR